MAGAYACEGGSDVISVKRSLGLAALAATALAVTGCSGVRESMGAGGKGGPDETAIATRAPLVVPATFDLKAPQPGAPRPQDADTAATAQRILGGGAARSAPASDGEKALLSATGANAADPNIRQELRQETREAQKRKSYADGVLFWRGDRLETGTPLIAGEEAQHLQTMQQRPVAQPAPQPALAPVVIEKAPDEPAPAEAAADAKEAEEKAKAEEQEEDGGWFDWF
jgi:hypothetical protein